MPDADLDFGLDVDVTRIVPGVSAASLGKAEDAAHASGDTGVMLLAVRKDTAAALAGTDGDYIPVIVDASGRLHIAPLVAGTAAIGKLAANSGVDIGDVDVTSIAAGENHLGEVGGRTVNINSSFTRPADTTAYAAGDAVTDSTSTPTVNTLTNAARINAGSGVILNAALVDSANQATAGQFEAWVFDTTVTPDNDNAVFTPTDAECATLVAIIPFSVSYVGDATAGAGGNRVYLSDPVNRGFVCGAATRNLFWLLVVRNAYTPVSAGVFTLRLTIAQD